ncbi:unnamed protein product [Urochloa humidicola]
MAAAVTGRWMRVRTLGCRRGHERAQPGRSSCSRRGPSCPRSARRMSSRLGFHAKGGGGKCQIFQEFVPGGSLVDTAARAIA